MELDLRDAREIIRLLGEVAAKKGGHAAQKRTLMTGLCELIGADAWIWALGCQLQPGALPLYTTILHGGFSEERFVRYLAAIEHPDMAMLTEPMLVELQEQETHLTRLRQQIGSTELFQSTGAYPLWCAADIGPLVLSLRPLGDGSVVCVALYRRKDAPLFNERESCIAHILLSEVAWLHELGWPEDRGVTVPQLSPRERVVLNLLLDGKKREQIAAVLGITTHTVNGYVKGLFRHFAVSSQAGLLARFRRSDGGDRIA